MCVGTGWLRVCVCVRRSRGWWGPQKTNFRCGLISRANELRQESAELVNSWRGLSDRLGQEVEHTHTHTALSVHCQGQDKRRKKESLKMSEPVS